LPDKEIGDVIAARRVPAHVSLGRARRVDAALPRRYPAWSLARARVPPPAGVRMPPFETPSDRRRDWRRAPAAIIASFRAHECFFLAAGISFYFMLSLIPMLFLLLAVIGYFLRDSASVQADLLGAVREYIPFLTNEIVRNIEQVVQNPGVLGWIGGGALFLSTDLVFIAIQLSLDKIFVPGRRGFLKSKVFSVLSAVTVFIVILSTIAVNAVDASLARIEALRLLTDGAARLPVGLHLSTWMIALLLVGSFTLAIRVLPHVDVPMRYAFWGGCLAAGLWLLGKAYYVWYLLNVSKVGPLFGSLSAVILTLIWVYVSALFFLLGAELTRWLILTDPRRAELSRPAQRAGADGPEARKAS
jgi:membrane protein